MTAEDVQSSLYYFHVNHADNTLLPSPTKETDKMEEQGDEIIRAELTKIRKRKPVGSQRKAFPSKSQLEQQMKNDGGMPAIRSSKQTGNDFLPDQQFAVLSPRKATVLNIPPSSGGHIYQPRNLQEENIRPNSRVPIQSNLMMETKRAGPQDTNYPSIKTYENRSNLTNDNWHNSFSATQGSGGEVNRIYESTIYSAIEDQPRSGCCEGTPSNFDDDLHITVIRRDPASGAQWNVGKIIDPSSVDVSLAALHNPQGSERGRKTDSPFFVELYTPGYEKFISDLEVQQQYESGTTSQKLANQVRQTSSMEYDETHSRPKGVFMRRLWTEPSRLGKIEKAPKRYVKLIRSRHITGPS